MTNPINGNNAFKALFASLQGEGNAVVANIVGDKIVFTSLLQSREINDSQKLARAFIPADRNVIQIKVEEVLVEKAKSASKLIYQDENFGDIDLNEFGEVEIAEMTEQDRAFVNKAVNSVRMAVEKQKDKNTNPTAQQNNQLQPEKSSEGIKATPPINIVREEGGRRASANTEKSTLSEDQATFDKRTKEKDRVADERREFVKRRALERQERSEEIVEKEVQKKASEKNKA